MPSQSASSNPDEGLPEWEPLTPELVEDEAIRGDFVIRWAVVGLALLFGFAPITDSRTLVHIRSGEYMAAHGMLPPSKDVFSYTATDRAWINLSWLFDLACSAVHSLSGGIGLTVVQGLIAGLTFGLLVHTYRSDIRSWWGSICATLSLLVCYPQFTSQPELITLLGLAVVMWLIQRFQESANSKLLWSCVPVIWLWSQFDTRAFLGWLLLLCLAIGESLSRLHNSAQRRALWGKVALASLAVTIIHPFLWHSWLSPIRLFAIDYPALQHAFTRPGAIELGFYPITKAEFWSSINHDTIAALVLFAATIVSLILNRERLQPGHWIAVLVFNGLACLATHEFAAASLVNCVVCTINAQTWFRHRFGQVYSIDWRELLFSRGGRAVTVLSFFALAWLVISGRIDGPSGRRTGLGFDRNLLVQMESYQQIAKDNLDDRPFHFTARQGDFLIWSGQKSFIDTRAAIFTGSGANDLIALHDQTRRAIQKKRPNLPGSGDPEIWRKTFEKYQLTHTMPRLSGPSPQPDYLTFSDLLSSNDWVLTDLTASTAVWYRSHQGPPISDYVASHRIEFTKQAFRTDEKPADTVRVCGKPASLSDGIFAVRQPRSPAGVQKAGHYLQLALASDDLSPRRAACALLAIRSANAGLREDSNCADGYRCLGLAYLVIDQLETRLMNESKANWFNSVRFYESVAALNQATALNPDDLLAQFELFGLFQRTQRGELALESIHKLQKLRPVTADASEQEQREQKDLASLEFNLSEKYSQLKTQVNEQLEKGADRLQVAAQAYQYGAIRMAIQALEDDPIYKERNPMARTALGSWLLEVGRIQEGLDALEQASAVGGVPGVRDTYATSLLINGDYNRAIEQWRQQLNESSTNQTQAALLTLPFVTLNSVWLSADQYPFTHLAAAGEIVGTGRGEHTTLTYQIGQAQLEQGDIPGARQSFQHLLEQAPNSQIRVLVKFYLELLTDKTIELPAIESPQQEEFEPIGEETAKSESKPAVGEKK